MEEASSTTKTSLSEGQVLDGKYQILEKVGHGGMGIVYRARHILMDREVALKVLHTHLIESEEFLKRFKHEAQVASKLNHPNAVMIYDFGMTASQPYLVMEFVQGDTLKDLLARGGALAPRDLLDIMSQVFSALEEAHRLGIVHRDLKPDNFILTKKADGSYLARVLDFGIAKLLPQTGSKEQTMMTQAGAFFGTPRYASPEQALGKDLDLRADIYALGVILYEGLSGEVPFDAPSMMELLLKHLNQSPPPIRTRHPELGISDKLEKVVQKALEKEKEQRYQTVGELAAAFRDAVINSEAQIQSGGKGPIIFVGSLIALFLAAAVYLLMPSKESKVEVDAVASSGEKAITAVDLVAPGAEPVAQVAESVPSQPVVVEQESAPSTVPTAFPTESAPPITEPIATQSQIPTPIVTPIVTSSPVATPLPTAVETAVPTQTPSPTPLVSEDLSKLDAVALFKKGETHYRARSYLKAIPYYQAVIAQDASFKKARLSLGICYLRLRKMDEAFEQFKAAFELDREYPPTLFNLSCYYALTGQTDSALKWLEKTIQYEPAAKRWARSEQDFANIRRLQRFKEITED